MKQVKLQKNNNSVLEIMIGNSDDISTHLEKIKKIVYKIKNAFR